MHRAYIAALTLTALLSGTAFLALDEFITSQDDAAAVINVAGRQRMLSQRIGGLASAVVAEAAGPEAPPELEADLALLRRAIDEMDVAHEGLMHGNPERSLPGIASPEEAALYRSAPTDVDARVTRFLAQARTVLADLGSRAAVDAAAAMASASRHELLAALHAVVQHHEEVATRKAQHAERIHLALLVTTLLVLLGEGVIIFRPLVRELDAATRNLQGKQAELVHQARHDALTGLPNRRALQNLMDEGLGGPGAGPAPRYAMIAIDLDNFKGVNDAHGHEVGDELLRDVGAVLASKTRGRNVAFRIGGDEFLVMVPMAETDGDDIPMRVAKRIDVALRETISCDDRLAGVSASSGIARAPQDGTTFETVIANADIALYHAKALGRDRMVAFHPGLREAFEEQREWEIFVREGIERDAFVPHFQPQIDMRTGAVVGVEALARAIAPDGAIIPPAEFLPAAEAAGLIVPLGKMVIEKAIAQAARWLAEDLTFGRVSVNASPLQLRDPDFVPFLERCLAKHALPARMLAVEILESVLLEDENDEIVGRCREIRALGVVIELDVFGTGYASIANVELLGVERIKIDRSFLRRSTDTERDLLRAIVTMADGLRIDVLAEGVETDVDQARLMELGCYKAQGYRFARPMPPGAFVWWLDAQISKTPTKAA